MPTAVLCMLLVLFGNSPAYAAEKIEFADVPPHYWAYDDIQFMASYGVINGYENGKFKYGKIITRKDAAVMLARALELDSAKPSEEQEFAIPDVPPTLPGYGEILATMEYNWFSLNEEGKFEPDKPLTRDEMAKALAMAFSYEGKGKSEFTDIEEDHPYYPYIDAIDYYRVTTGYKDQTYRPKEPITRVQFAVFLSRVFQQPAYYEIRNAGEVVAKIDSLGSALKKAEEYPQGTIHPASTKYRKFSDKLASEDKTDIKAGTLIYNGVNEKETFSKEYFDRYTSYQTPDGQTKDFFQTFIIAGLRYDGGRFAEVPENKADYIDWKNYIERTFAEQGALNQLNLSAKGQNKQVDVYIAIPYPKQKDPILKLNDEVVENNLESRKELVNWYITEVAEEWEKNDFGHLNFKGFYWLNETVRSYEDERLLPAVAERIHEDGRLFIYSPHATSTNFKKWKSYGFDAAFLQPNAFRSHLKDKEKRLHMAFLKAQMYGTGINIEINSYSQAQAHYGEEAFDLYIDYAKRYGLDEKGMIFYQGVNMVERMATYDHPIFKKWYQQLTSTFFKDQHPPEDRKKEDINSQL